MEPPLFRREKDVAATSPLPSSSPPGANIAALPGPAPADVIYEQILVLIEPAITIRLARPEITSRIERLVAQIADRRRLLVNREEQQRLTAAIVDDMTGLGPLQVLLGDETISDILVNGPYQVYIERHGKLHLTEHRFRSDLHVLHVAQRIASSVGRRIDESSPMLDARLADGSRVNVTIPPLCLNGPCISIRKFTREFLDFSNMVAADSMSPELAQALKIAARCRLNILISGGTGAGKTTLLNAMSSMIDHGERVVTIEDTAELQLQQPHVVRLETRPPNVEGKGQVTQRDLVRNALRMRPDRIIVGDVRGPEAFDMIQAMNTGHAGSLSSIHANSARDALDSVENMVMTANLGLPSRAIRRQIASVFDLVVHLERMHDGARRVVELSEVSGMSRGVVALRNLFEFKYRTDNADGTLNGTFEATGVLPQFLPRLQYYGLADAFMSAVGAARHSRPAGGDAGDGLRDPR